MSRARKWASSLDSFVGCYHRYSVWDHRSWCHQVNGRQSWNVQLQESQENCFERYAGVHWSVPAVASQSHQSTSSRSDDIWWSRPHSRTGKWSGHGWYKGARDFVRWSEMWCVGTLSSEDVFIVSRIIFQLDILNSQLMYAVQLLMTKGGLTLILSFLKAWFLLRIRRSNFCCFFHRTF